MSFGDINILTVILAAIIKMVLGAIWYSPKVFGDTWAQSTLAGKVEDVKATPMHYACEAVVSLLMALILAIFINWTGPETVLDAIIVGFLIWLGFVATTQLSGVIWGKTPLKTYLINTSFVLISLILMSIVITLWG